MLRNAIVRPPGASFARGLTTANLGAPDLDRALEQHRRYCEALARCGLTVTQLEPDPDHPDSAFVEDTAVLTPECAILTRPGAASRRGEIAGIRPALAGFFRTIREITPPGTVDGGDVCEADDHFFIGISGRTNPSGARQLAALLAEARHPSIPVDIRAIPGMLHLKSGVASLGDRRLIMTDALAGLDAFRGWEIVPVAPEESYAANGLRVNGHVLLAAGYPKLAAALHGFGCPVIAVEMGEFRRMDGGLSCLSLRF